MMALVLTTATGCVKVVKIGEEASITGEAAFSPGDDVAGFGTARQYRSLQKRLWI